MDLLIYNIGTNGIIKKGGTIEISMSSGSRDLTYGSEEKFMGTPNEIKKLTEITKRYQITLKLNIGENRYVFKEGKFWLNDVQKVTSMLMREQ